MATTLLLLTSLTLGPLLPAAAQTMRVANLDGSQLLYGVRDLAGQVAAWLKTILATPPAP